MRILVIQLARMGDIIQSTKFLLGLRQYYPDAKINLLCIKGYEALGCLLNNFVDEVYTISLGFDSDWTQAYKRLRKYIAQLGKYDIVYNLNFWDVAIELAHMLGGEVPFYKKIGDKIYKNHVLAYLFALARARKLNRLNIIDILACADSKSPNGFKLEKIPLNNRVALQIGAGHVLREWLPQYWRKLCELLLQNGLNPVVFAPPDDRELVKYITKNLKIELILTPKLEDYITALKTCSILIAVDTGGLHLGWFLGLRIIGLYFGSAHLFDTPPYGDGHIIFYPDMECYPCKEYKFCKNIDCRNVLTPEIVLSTVKFFYDGDSIKENAGIKCLETICDNWGLNYKPKDQYTEFAIEFFRKLLDSRYKNKAIKKPNWVDVFLRILLKPQAIPDALYKLKDEVPDSQLLIEYYFELMENFAIKGELGKLNEFFLERLQKINFIE